MERAAGIEPACLTWKDSALPLSYARVVAAPYVKTRVPSKSFLPFSGIIFSETPFFRFSGCHDGFPKRSSVLRSVLQTSSQMNDFYLKLIFSRQVHQSFQAYKPVG